MAMEKDREREQMLKEGKELFLFHGVPISVKDIVRVYWYNCLDGHERFLLFSGNFFPFREETNRECGGSSTNA